MRVLFTSTSGQGHFQPLVPLIRGFEARGDEVLLVGPASLAASATHEAIQFRPGGEPSPDDATRVWTLFPTLERKEASRLVEREWFASLCFDALLPEVERTIERWRPDYVVRESCEYAAAYCADRASIPQAQVGISSAAAEAAVLLKLVAPSLDQRSDGLAHRVFATPYLTKFPVSLDPSSYPATFRYRESPTVIARPLDAWWPGDERPLVYLTLGTVAMRVGHGKELLRVALASLADLEVRVLVTTGRHVAPEELGVQPANVHVESWVDQDSVLTQASVVVCHGGSGTVFGSLAAGVPLVLLPMFADQPTNAATIEAFGAGLRVIEGGRSADENLQELTASSERLRDAVLETLENPRFREAASTLAGELGAALTPGELAERLAKG